MRNRPFYGRIDTDRSFAAGKVSHLDHYLTVEQPEIFVFASHNWSPDGVGSGYCGEHDGARTLLGHPLPLHAEFNALPLPEPDLAGALRLDVAALAGIGLGRRSARRGVY
ncbi:MAG: hypothetical protein CL908_17360 [Deltaproteobacteria bacterium]|nr:hypothetical protein [Deltaproteobacteria bacterium]